jgi:hypothetical protein
MNEEALEKKALIEERAVKPWLHINDVFRMSLTVSSVEAARNIGKDMVEYMLHNGRTKI